MAIKAINFELEEDAVLNAVRSVVDEEMPEAVRDAVREHAATMIKERVDERIGCVLDEMLAAEQFVTGHWDQNAPLDQMIKNAVRSYLDERVYLYSYTNDRPSVRFTRNSYQGDNSAPTRLEAFLRFSIERFCDEHLAAKLESTVKEFLDQRGGVEQVAREQMARLLKEKFKL